MRKTELLDTMDKIYKEAEKIMMETEGTNYDRARNIKHAAGRITDEILEGEISGELEFSEETEKKKEYAGKTIGEKLKSARVNAEAEGNTELELLLVMADIAMPEALIGEEAESYKKVLETFGKIDKEIARAVMGMLMQTAVANTLSEETKKGIEALAEAERTKRERK